jgi:hypothetical protein
VAFCSIKLLLVLDYAQSYPILNKSAAGRIIAMMVIKIIMKPEDLKDHRTTHAFPVRHPDNNLLGHQSQG